MVVAVFAKEEQLLKITYLKKLSLTIYLQMKSFTENQILTIDAQAYIYYYLLVLAIMRKTKYTLFLLNIFCY